MSRLFPLLAVLIWSGNALVNKLSTDVIEPGAISFYRWFVAMLVLAPFCLPYAWSNRKLIQAWLPKLTVLAALGMVLNQALGYFAASTTTATNMALITSMVPLVAIFMSRPILGQAISANAIIGGLISLAGLILMLSQGNVAALLASGLSRGDGLMLMSVIVYALYSVLLKRWNLPFSTWQAVYYQVCISVILQLPMLLASPSANVSLEALPLVVYAGLLASVVAPYCWLLGVKKIGPAKTASFMNCMPIFAAIMATFFLGEQLTEYHYLGGLIVLVGIALSQHNGRIKKYSGII